MIGLVMTATPRRQDHEMRSIRLVCIRFYTRRVACLSEEHPEGVAWGREGFENTV